MSGRSAEEGGRPPPRRVLVAGVGNPLRGDDGFGPRVIQALEEGRSVPERVTLVDVGIGGMGLVHELMGGFEALVVVDAVDRGAAPGTLLLVDPELPEPEATDGGPGRAITADMHEMVPERVFELASALGVLPPRVRIVGCQPARTDELTLELSPPVARAVEEAVGEVLRLVEPAPGTEDPWAAPSAGSSARTRDTEGGHGPEPR